MRGELGISIAHLSMGCVGISWIFSVCFLCMIISYTDFYPDELYGADPLWHPKNGIMDNPVPGMYPAASVHLVSQ